FFYSALTISTLYLLSIHDRHFENTSGRTVSFFLPLALQGESTISQSTQPISRIPEVNFCDILPCDKVYCCPIHQAKSSNNVNMKSKQKENQQAICEIIKNKTLFLIFLGIDTTISSIQILETQQSIDNRYCSKNLQCSTTEPLIVFLCKVTFGNYCSHYSSSQNSRKDFLETTQGRQHIWTLPVAKLYDSAYYFRVAAPGFAGCSTDPYFAGMFFTDYYFYFYRQCN
uniref:Myelin gene regulatory factor C-terminal domain-containing protein n=1 Tax=Strix occidentalis caurina TaxID=311401 RepID=A0A8D0F0Q4_STROC